MYFTVVPRRRHVDTARHGRGASSSSPHDSPATASRIRRWRRRRRDGAHRTHGRRASTAHRPRPRRWRAPRRAGHGDEHWGARGIGDGRGGRLPTQHRRDGRRHATHDDVDGGPGRRARSLGRRPGAAGDGQVLLHQRAPPEEQGDHAGGGEDDQGGAREADGQPAVRPDRAQVHRVAEGGQRPAGGAGGSEHHPRHRGHGRAPGRPAPEDQRAAGPQRAGAPAGGPGVRRAHPGGERAEGVGGAGGAAPGGDDGQAQRAAPREAQRISGEFRVAAPAAASNACLPACTSSRAPSRAPHRIFPRRFFFFFSIVSRYNTDERAPHARVSGVPED